MPGIIVGPYRFFFYSREGNEPPHVHVRRERFVATFWIDPIVEQADNKGFRAHELRQIRGLIEQYRESLLEKWHEHFGQD